MSPKARVTRRARILAQLRERGSGPKRSLGQNFLVSDHVIDKILFAVKAEPFAAMIEVGPGLGALTEDLIEISSDKKVPLTLIELDSSFASEWNARAEGGTIKVVEADALQVEWSALGLPDDTLFVSNLPYQISSSLVIDRSIDPAGVTRMILMFQKEVAQRIGAKAKTEDYGLLTVIAQTFWQTATVSDAGPKDFFPPPNVASRVLAFKKRSPALLEPSVAKKYLSFVKSGFSHRRKLLAKNLAGGGYAPEKIADALAEMKLLPTARAEELSPPQFVQLFGLATRF
ncbi:MAG: 16S rRNA (adenine(1518)-N(6)/adenine(1519)-N(6))-dimethyltransferase RsmA [Bdellovibrionota bacterium]